MEKALRLDRGQIEVVDDAMAEVLRRKTPAERIRIGFSIWISAHNMLMVHLKKTHPEWNTERLNKEVAGRLGDGDLMNKHHLSAIRFSQF
jgi:hypothetical protein